MPSRERYQANKELWSERQKQYRRTNPEVFRDRQTRCYTKHRGARRAHAREVYEQNREEELARNRAYREANKETIRRRKKLNYIKRTYGLSEDAYEALNEVQNGKCAICQREFTDERTPNVDHDHESGRIRGLLCHDCNVVLGFAHDSSTTLQQAILYLQR